MRAQRSLDELDGWLPPAGVQHLRSGAEMAAGSRRYPGAIENSVRFAEELRVRAAQGASRDCRNRTCPDGHTPMSYLRELVWEGMKTKAIPPTKENIERIEHELDVIEQKDFPRLLS